MSHNPGTGNRFALAAWALVLLAASSWVLVPAAIRTLGGTAAGPAQGTWGADPGRRVLDMPGDIATNAWAPAAAIAVGALLLLLAVAWLVRQLPRSPGAGTLKLSDDVANGVTWMHPGVLERALKQLAEDDPAVQNAQVSVHGSAMAPELVVHVSAEPWARLPVLGAVLAERLRTAVGTSLGQDLRALDLDFSVARKQRQGVRRGEPTMGEQQGGLR